MPADETGRRSLEYPAAQMRGRLPASRTAPAGASVALLALLALGASPAHAETGYDGWLRYAPVPASTRVQYAALPRTVVTLGDSPVLTSARDEIVRGLGAMLGERAWDPRPTAARTPTRPT
jgi:alpha-glucuronidase